MKSPAMRKLRCLLCYWSGRLPRSVKKSHIADISLCEHRISEEDPQELTGLGLLLCRFFLATAILYKGPSGIIDSGIAGLILGTAYMLAGRNLWACIFTHG